VRSKRALVVQVPTVVKLCEPRSEESVCEAGNGYTSSDSTM